VATNYNFSRFNDKEFESLACDVLSAEWDMRIERFKPGKDKGVDGRFFTPDGGAAIIQVKHYKDSGLPALLRALKREVEKVHKLRPRRYIVVTSVALSAHNKDAIRDLFSPYLSAADVFGESDLQALLGKHPDLERTHYKLWLSSAQNLKTIYSAAIIGRSDSMLEEALRRSVIYVLTNSHARAVKKLEEKRVAIITGEPGIGKTTLAEQILLEYKLRLYEPLVIQDDVKEAESAWTPGQRQIFYFDDFLGRNYLSALERHEDTAIVRFITRVISDPKKRFLLTSRTAILNQAKNLSGLLKDRKVEENELEIKIFDLSLIDKAQMLYNHVWHGELEGDYVEQIYLEKRYRKLVRHENFNPRIISFITDLSKVSVPASEYWAKVKSMLDHPRDIWRDVFENQIDDLGGRVAALVVFNGGKAAEQAVISGMRALCAGEFAEDTMPIVIGKAIRLATGAVVNRQLVDGRVELTLFNPSVGDYLIGCFQNEAVAISRFVGALATLEALNNLHSLKKSGVLAGAHYEEALFEVGRALLLNDSVDLSVRHKLLNLIGEADGVATRLRVQIGEFLNIVVRDPAGGSWFRLAGACKALIQRSVVASDSPIVALVIQRGCNDFQSMADVDAVGELYAVYTGSDSLEIGALVYRSFRDFAIGSLEVIVNDEDLISGRAEREADLEGAVDSVRLFFEDRVVAYGLPSDGESIADLVTPDMVEPLLPKVSEYSEEPEWEHEYDGRKSRDDSDSAIDDIFDRDI
jgi:broad-specificity NMP kinase